VYQSTYQRQLGEQLEDVREGVLERLAGDGEGGQADRGEVAPQSHHGQQVPQHGQDAHVAQQVGTRHVVAALDQGHRAEEVEHQVSNPLDEGLQHLQRRWT
jgi:hypothetical protein